LQKNGIEKFRAHDEILQVRSEGYSNCSENIVNDSNRDKVRSSTARAIEID
jgi:hypothetical protein